MFLNRLNGNKLSVISGAVVITGASTGIGKAAALMLDKRGFHVFAGVRKESDGAALRQEASGKLRPVILDVTKRETITAVQEQVQTAINEQNIPNGLVGLVNNAGIVVAGPLEFLPLDEIRWQFEVNVLGVLATTQPFLPLLRQAKGRIVNISSIAGRFAPPFMGPYTASKHALEALSDSMRLELRPWGIQVVLVEPGEVATPIWEKSLAAANKLLAKMPPDTFTLYGPPINMMREQAGSPGGVSADVVAKDICHAITAARPKTRYLIGQDAKMQSMIGRLPTSLRDRLVASQLPAYGD